MYWKYSIKIDGRYCQIYYEGYNVDDRTKKSTRRMLDILDQLCLFKTDKVKYFRYMVEYEQ